MLHVKRASAGSGKTYQLAKMYIKLLLTVKEPGKGKKRRLRTEESLKEALSSIMAVTFTVKATGEMKQRIIENLANLAKADLPPDKRPKHIEYLDDFIKELSTTELEIARLSRAALRHLLLHFSDFRVQTIDSFFQSVLHTFAYEASLDDNFNMEIDSGYINTIGFDSALDSLSQIAGKSKKNKEVLHWLNLLMKQESGKNKWNVFTRNDNESYLYSKLIKDTVNLEKEEFHKVKEDLETYFNNLKRPFSEVVADVDTMVYARLKKKYDERKAAAEELRNELQAARLESSMLCQHAPNRHIESLEDFNPSRIYNLVRLKPLKIPAEVQGSSLSSNGRDVFKNNCRDYPELNRTKLDDIDSAYSAWRELHNEYLELIARELPAIKTWEHYKSMFPRLVIALEIAERKREFLDSTNTLQISDTAHLLSRIIDGEDTPFVYERYGSRLNHYLIDEFQDTSRMQWDNLYPLLAESESNGFNNLIIGDAKQSIYRFRNADYKLLQEIDGMFPDVVNYTSDEEPADMTKENTNFRSKPRIVEMNNFIFSNIVNEEIKGEGGRSLFEGVKEIYKDSVQALPEKKRKPGDPEPWQGYVELIIHPSVKAEKKDDSDDEGYLSLDNPGFKELIYRIKDLKSRGYDYRDIGILVRSHKQGKAVIRTISKHNNTHPEAQIPVISEENLLVAKALSIRIITRALEIAAGGEMQKVPANPVLSEPVGEKELFELLKGLPTLALPAVTEAIAERFIPESRRNEEAPFLAAFQDAVTDYCASKAGDIGQFLKWWKRKAKTLSISTPEESDGVKIQTIHKAKGLEHKCLIIPYGDFKFSPGKKNSEWRWVEPAACISGKEMLPPVVPVMTTSNLSETAHADVRAKYCEEVALDELNNMYVAFTRAAKELYVYLPVPKEDAHSSAATILYDMIREENESDTRSPLLAENIKMEEKEGDRTEITYGVQASTEQILREKKRDKTSALMLTRYDISSEGAALQFGDGNKLLNASPRVVGDGDELEARTEGKLKHRVMQMVETIDDLPKALREMKREGYVSKRDLKQWEEELEGAIRKAESYGWFDSRNRVINERPILQKGHINYRPDRVVVDTKGNATVIDYKFGERNDRHKKQVKNYMALLRESKKFASVKGYLWYVAQSDPEEVV